MIKRTFRAYDEKIEILRLYRSCVEAAFHEAGMEPDYSFVPTVPASVRADSLRRLFLVAYDVGRREALEDRVNEVDDGK